MRVLNLINIKLKKHKYKLRKEPEKKNLLNRNACSNLQHKFIFIAIPVTRFNEIIIKLHIAHDEKFSFRNFFHKILFKFFLLHILRNHRNVDG